MDVLAQLHRELPAGEWVYEYRFRYYEDEKFHDSADRKSGYRGTFPGVTSEEAIWERVGVVASLMLKELLPPGFTVDVVDIQTDEPEAIAYLLGQRPWASAKRVPISS